MNTKQLDEKYVANTYARFDVNIVNGNGSILTDDSGKEYIDMGTGIAVNTFGVADKEWIDAVTKQLNMFQHTSNLYYSEPCAKLAEMLCERTGMKKVFFSNSGAEANECAIKAARKYGETNLDGATTIITLKNSFHGRTITTLSATGQDVFHKDFLPLTEGFVYANANDVEDVKDKIKENQCCAIMFECIQGEAGVLNLEDDFVKGIVTLAKEHNMLVIVDEVQTGNGRTGNLYAYQKYGISPDIVSTAKGLAGGLPIGATMLGEKVENIYTPGTHGSTFGGNPVCCAGGVNILSRIDDKLLKEVKEKSDYIFKTLKDAKGVKSVSGCGFIIGIETEKDASEVVSKCVENGVLVLKAKNKVRLLPALNIPQSTLEKAIKIIINACK